MKTMNAEERLDKMGIVQLYTGVVFGGYIWAYDHDKVDTYIKVDEESFINGDEPEDMTEMTSKDVLVDVVKMIKEQRSEVTDKLSGEKDNGIPSDEYLEDLAKNLEYLNSLLEIAEG